MLILTKFRSMRSAAHRSGWCAIGVFLGAYRGYEFRDRVAGWIACVCAIGVALCPVNPSAEYYALFHYAEDPNGHSWRWSLGLMHYAFALGMFSTLAYFCLG